jgi:hypothetical protein
MATGKWATVLRTLPTLRTVDALSDIPAREKICWRGYLAAMLEGGLLQPNQYDDASGLHEVQSLIICVRSALWRLGSILSGA